MRKKCVVALVILFIAVGPIMPAVAAELPKVLAEGFDQYLKEGPKAAIEAWAKGSATEGSKEALSQANQFRQMQDFYGNFIGYNIVKVKAHSNTSSAYYVEIKYEKGNLFSTFYTYKKPDGKVVLTNFSLNTHAEKIWPSFVLMGSPEIK